MSIFDRARNFLRFGTSGFNEFERRLLAAVANELPTDIQRQKLQRRIAAINLVQRLDGGREINCFEMKSGAATFDDETRLDSGLDGEELLAEVQIDGSPGTKNAAKVWLVNGNLFSIEFVDPTEHAEVSSVDAIKVRIASNFLQSKTQA